MFAGLPGPDNLIPKSEVGSRCTKSYGKAARANGERRFPNEPRPTA